MTVNGKRTSSFSMVNPPIAKKLSVCDTQTFRRLELVIILEEINDRDEIEMEDYQISLIEKKLPLLIKNTRCTTLVKSILTASGILTEEEVEILVYTKLRINID